MILQFFSWALPITALIAAIAFANEYGVVTLTDASASMKLCLLNFLIPPLTLLLLFFRLAEPRVLLLLSAAAILIGLPVIPLCSVFLVIFNLDKVLRIIGLLLFSLMSMACLLLYFLGHSWYSAIIYDHSPKGAVLGHQIVGPYDVYIYRYNNTGAAGDFDYALERELKISKGIILSKTLDSQYGGTMSDLILLDPHTLSFNCTQQFKDLGWRTLRKEVSINW